MFSTYVTVTVSLMVTVALILLTASNISDLVTSVVIL